MCCGYLLILVRAQKLEPIQIHIRHVGGVRALRVFMVSRQRTFAKTKTKVHEGHRDKAQRISKRVPGT